MMFSRMHLLTGGQISHEFLHDLRPYNNPGYIKRIQIQVCFFYPQERRLEYEFSAQCECGIEQKWCKC